VQNLFQYLKLLAVKVDMALNFFRYPVPRLIQALKTKP